MSKILHFFNILIIYCGCFLLFLFFMPSFIVKASDFTFYDDPGIASVYLGIDYGNGVPNTVVERQTGTPHSCYYYNLSGTRASCMLLTFAVDDSNIIPSNNIKSYSYNFNGVDHTIYYSTYGTTADFWVGTYVSDCSGTQEFTYPLQNDSQCQAVCNYFLFGVGSLDYEKPPQDIEDADLDIVGLSCYILNNQTGSVDYQQTLINTFFAFLNTSIKSMFGSDIEFFMPENSQGIIENYVPGIALSWDSPPLDPDINYNIWVDGISNINYKTSPDPLSNFLNTQNISSCAYAKLKINDSPLTKSNDVYYYNTNEGLETILTYIEDHSSLSAPSGGFNRYSYVSLETKISRVYIQASKVVDGDTHYGALSYIDIIDSVPVVYEGVTSSVNDVPASDPSGGTPAVVGTPFTVSGDSITYGDTYYDNSITNNITGLAVTGDILSVARSLFGAIWSLIKSLFLALLVPWILLGFTGSTKGSFLL